MSELLSSRDVAPPPERSGGGAVPSAPSALRLAAITFLILFLELALIRYVSAYVRVFGFYLNLVLIATFLGMGVGLLTPDDRRNRWLGLLALPALLALVKAFSNVLVRPLQDADEFVWGEYFEMAESIRTVGIVPTVLLLFTASAVVMVPLGAALAREFRKHPTLRAYSLDIAGSLAGIVAFGAASALQLPPLAWFAVVAVVWVALSAERRARDAALVASALASLALVAWTSRPQPEYWSPYYRVNVFPGPAWLSVHVNGSMHQWMIDFEPRREVARDVVNDIQRQYRLPYPYAPRLDTVLVVGAGTGNDVANLLAAGARHVDAVEIDPVILSIGRLGNPERVYEDPRVTAIVGDARAFLRRTSRRYDAVVFGTLDSQTLLSGMSSLRLDNYVYTMESFAAARARLRPGGVVITYHMSHQPWIAAKIYQALDAAFGAPPLTILAQPKRLFNYTFIGGVPGAPPTPALEENVELPHDDWPYLYLRRRTVPAHYLWVLGGMLVIAGAMVGGVARGPLRRGADWTMFFLGVGFLLLETKSVTEMSLLFGSTWEVNLLVFASILAVILVANAVIARRGASSVVPWFAGLFATMLGAWAIPTSALLALAPAARFAAAAAVVALPVFFAGSIFATVLARRADPARALAFNVLGAILGGVLEYSSMILGTKALYGVAAVAYAAAWVASRHADGESARSTVPGAPASP